MPFLVRVMVLMNDRSICELATGDMFMPTYVLTYPPSDLKKANAVSIIFQAALDFELVLKSLTSQLDLHLQ